MRLLRAQKKQKASAIHKLLQSKSVLFVLSVLMTFLIASPAYSQTVHVKGKVTDDQGQPVPKASVLVKGTRTGVSGDDNGNFEINAPANATLVISAVNFTTTEVKVNNRQALSVKLTSSEKTESEVVVVGYGTQRKRDVTGSVVSISAATLAETPGVNIIAELKGRAAGVDIVSNSSTPGGSGSIRIRGNRSMATNSGQSDLLDQPLLVVDGIPFGGSINDISPDDISSLEILKDASATAIYGSRGSGGVILITTRRGRVGKPQMSLSSTYGISSVMGDLPVLNGTEFAQLKQDIATYNRTAPGSNNGLGLTSVEQANLAAGVNTDWQKLIYKNGFTTDNQLSLSGGNETTQYGIGAGFYSESNEIPNQKFDRYSLRVTIDHQISKSIKIGVNSLTTLGISNNPGGGGVPGTLLKLSPLALPYNTDGTINLYPQPGIDAATYVNPLTLKTASQSILARTRRIRAFNSLYGEWAIPWVKGLKYRLNVGLDYSDQENDNYSGIMTYVNNLTDPLRSTATVGSSMAYRWTVENILTYDKTIGKNRINLTGLFSTQKDHAQNNSTTALGVPSDYIQNTNLGLAGGAITATGGFSEQGLISYMGRLNYSYDNRYLLTATVRRDGSSVLSPGHQWYTYPAFSLGWNIMNEKFANNWSNLFSNLKIRGGWGITSNQGVAPYTTLGLLNATAYTFGQGATGQQVGYTVGTLPNENLQWESTAQTNIGLDFGILKNRITGSVEVYQQHTKNILLSVGLPISNGANSYTANIGKTSGHGVEVSLSTINIKSASGFTWSTDFNFYFNREKIVQLTTPSEKSNLGNGWFVGQPLTVIYDLKKVGIWQTADSGAGHLLAAQTTPVEFPGQIRVQDLNGDGKITPDDRQIIGNFQPRWEGGLTSRMNYKNFDFSFTVFARMGMKVLVPYVSSDGGANGATFFNQGRINQLKVDYWTRSNPTNNFPAPDASLQSPLFGSTLQYQDGSFIKMRSINLGYTFSDKLLHRTGITSLRVFAAIENPFILYSPFVRDGFGPDPEGNGYGGAVTSGASYSNDVNTSTNRQISVNSNNPSMLLVHFGLNLRF